MDVIPVEFMQWQWAPSPPDVIGLNSSNIGYYPSEDLVGDPAALTSTRHPYTPAGMDALRERLAALYQVPVEEVLITAGTTLANFLALCASAPPGSRVAIETPGYEPLTRAAQAAGLVPMTFRRPAATGFRPDRDEVAACLTAGARIVVVTDLHNPSGASLLDEDVAALRELCARHGARLLVDEVYRDFPRLDAPRSLRADGGPVVATGSLTKVYGLSWLRTGWVLGPREVIARALEIESVLYPEVPMPTQVMACHALDRRGEIAAWAAARLAPTRAMVERYLGVERRLGGLPPRDGSVWFPLLPDGVDGDAFCDALLTRYKVRVAPGRYFGMPSGMRIGLGVDPDLLRAALAKISRLLDEVAPAR